MIRLGVSLIIAAILLWFSMSFITIFLQAPIEAIIYSAIVLGISGSIIVLIGVGKDRYREIKEEKKNNDYRKY